jgi:hypothetical protein
MDRIHVRNTIPIIGGANGMTTENKRDLAADLAICEAATAGPWLVDENTANQIRQPNGSKRRRITTPPDADGIKDAAFIAKAREGWPESIRRAMAAEAEVERLRKDKQRLHSVYDAQYARAVEYWGEVERLRTALETAQFHLDREQYMSASDTVDSALEVNASDTQENNGR